MSRSLVAADADILETHGSQPYGVEQILGVDDHWALQQMLDAVEVESAELGPAGADHQASMPSAAA